MYINFVYCTYKLYICDVFFKKKTKNRRKHPQKPAKKKNAGLPWCALLSLLLTPRVHPWRRTHRQLAISDEDLGFLD